MLASQVCLQRRMSYLINGTAMLALLYSKAVNRVCGGDNSVEV